ncbi:MAG TPA: methyl-accepting chemotaxis protein [Ignavibacteriaceae bacterium]|nr:methyl-accepting chemotaxis protein [Ignavibacteriaceae bacterium]
MNIKNVFLSLSIKVKIILIVAFFGLIIISYYSVSSYSSEKEIYINKIDDQLLTAAYSLGNLFGEEFHGRISGVNSISNEENIRNTDLLDELVERVHIDFLYTMVISNDSIFFTTGNVAREQLLKSGYEPFYLYYRDASDSLIKTFKDAKIRFDEYSDNYGSFRSVFIPFRTGNGKIYVAGADISLKYLDNLWEKILWRNLGGGSIIFLIFLALTYSVINFIVKPIHILKNQAVKISSGELDTEITVSSKDEIGQLSYAIEKMVASLKSTLKILAKEKANVESRIHEAVIESEEQKKYLEKSVDELLDGMKLFTEGDLSIKLHPEKEDKIGELYKGFNRSVEEFNSIVDKIIKSSNVIVGRSGDISASTEEMAAGSNEQMIQTNEVASSVDQMTKSILEGSRNINIVADNAKKAENAALEGGKNADETVIGMQRIAEVVLNASETVQKLGTKSSRIGEIIKVIEDIADQTNLLALNAAIEAARAGEQGKGFGVVADEVRKLAEKTTKATNEITMMIKDIESGTAEAVASIRKGTEVVQKGKELANNTGLSLREIIKSSAKVLDEVKQAASASEEQSKAAEKISRSIETINNVTSEAAQGIELVAKSAEDLNKLTENLQKMVSRFKVEDVVAEETLTS